MSFHIPIVDFSAYGLDVCDIDTVDKETFDELVSSVSQAFSSIGFCYLKNHGIPKETIQNVFDTSKEFFAKGYDTKGKYARAKGERYGWDPLEKESLNVGDPGDLKEAFKYNPWFETEKWFDIKEFQDSLRSMYDKCTLLTLRIFNVISKGLHLKDDNIFRNSHSKMGKKDNPTSLRSLYYPELPRNIETKSGQIRCGEHTDFGTITLLFQDDVGGLEVKTRDGTYIPATPIPDTVLVNIADLMQRWTADQLIATMHRVLIPSEIEKRRQCRQSLAFFVNPDDDVMVACLGGSNKYEPVNSRDYVFKECTNRCDQYLLQWTKLQYNMYNILKEHVVRKKYINFMNYILFVYFYLA